MNWLVLGVLGFLGYQFLKKDDRPAQMRVSAQQMLAQAAALENSGQPGAMQLRAQAQALIAQAAGIESGRIR